MFLAAVGDTPYRIVLVLHIVASIAAFAPVFADPLLSRQATALGGDGHRQLMGILAGNGRRVAAPALILAGLLGFGLQGMSSSAWEFSQGWMIGAMLVWIAMNGVLHALILPNQVKMSEGDHAAQRLADAGAGALAGLLLIMVWLMVFKPGL